MKRRIGKRYWEFLAKSTDLSVLIVVQGRVEGTPKKCAELLGSIKIPLGMIACESGNNSSKRALCVF